MSVHTTHQTPDPKTYYIRRTEHIDVWTQNIFLYNFVMYLILHCSQLYFNYISTVC